MRTLEEVREFMYQDTYAVETTGITIEEIDEDGCVYLRMPIDERHYNGIGRVMGGAIFTLADFAVASTIYANEILTAAISSSIEFIAAGQGAYLTAKGHLDKAGKKICFGGADIFDEAGTMIARTNAQSYVLPKPANDSAKTNYTYILKCSDGSYYTGWTNDLGKRLASHNDGTGSKYTNPRRPVELVHAEAFATKQEAMSREWEIKQMNRQEKEELIKKGNR